jgi:hypothetical protein
MSMKYRRMVTDTLSEAAGRSHRADPLVGVTGGPAGNAELTAWTGAVLLVLLAVEGVTVLDIRGLITWHVAVGLVLIPPALLKTASTGWRIIRYYSGNRSYRQAGPPPMPLRLLGPLVVVTTLAVLGTGTALIVIGSDASHRPLLEAAGFAVDAVMIHKATFVIWFGVTALHVLGRLVPALRLIFRSLSGAVPGRRWRSGAILLTMTTAAGVTAFILTAVVPWQFHAGH